MDQAPAQGLTWLPCGGAVWIGEWEGKFSSRNFFPFFLVGGKSQIVGSFTVRIQSTRSAWTNLLLGVSLSAAVFCLASMAKASVYLDNVTGPPDGGLLVAGTGRIALGFQVDASETSLWDFTIRVLNDVAPGSSVRLQIYNDTGGEPDDIVTPSQPFTLTPAGVSSPFSGTDEDGLYKFSGSGTLTSLTTYWLVAFVTGADEFGWIDAGAYTETGATFEGAQVFDGSNWDPAANPLSVQISQVPEPAQTGLIAGLFLVACSLTHLVRRRRPTASNASTSS